MKNTARLIAVGALALGGIAATAAPAAASCTLVWCGTVRVPSNPPGDGRGVIVTYSWGSPNSTDRTIFPGHSSREYGKDADGIYVSSGTDVKCTGAAPGYNQWFTSTGWHKINDLFNQYCYTDPA